MFTEEQIKSFTPMIQAYIKVKMEHMDKLVFYRMGDFYEMFFNDAVIASKILGITLTQKSTNSEIPIPMAGVPFHAVDTYIVKSLNKGYSIVICEQVEGTDSSKGIMERKVTKIVTPGTLLDNGVLDAKETKYLACVHKNGNNFDFAWVNFASGEIFCNRFSADTAIAEINRINPAEILVSEKHSLFFNFNNDINIQSLQDWNFDLITANHNMINHFGQQYIHLYGLPDIHFSVVISVLLNYLKETQCSEIRHIQNIKFIKSEDYLQIDSNSKKHLEITHSNSKHTLWNTLDCCATPMGSRMLKDWLNNPIKNTDILESRYMRIEFLIGNNQPFWDWKNIAQDWCDIERITTKIALKSVRPRELAALRNTLRTMPKLKLWIDKMPPHMKGFFIHAIPSDSIGKILESYLLEEPASWVRDSNVIANGIDRELDEYRSLSKGHDDFLKNFEENEKKTHNIPNLKVEYNSAQGFYISISNSHLNKIPTHYKRKQTLKNAERFTTDELSQYEDKALTAQEKSLAREKFLYEALLDKLQSHVGILQKQAKILAEWDVLVALAENAYKNNYKRPRFNSNNEIKMLNGRHPVLETVIPDFVPNSIILDRTKNMGIITGPNMGGKSTVMRQLALLIVMAHIGSFVPVDDLSIPDIDAIYTRIGANDDIANGRSTFMVEMSESAYIINNSTKNSLVLLDELGRGTATYDGLSLAWAIAEHLAIKTHCYTLFATHYLEMTSLHEDFSNIVNFHVSAIDQGDDIVFTHLIENGPASKSYGIHVAELAGILPQVLSCAKQKLSQLEKKNEEKYTSSDHNDLLTLDLSNMTPMQIMEWVYNKQKQLKAK